MADDLQEPARVEVESASVKHVRPGLGNLLFGAAAVAFLATSILAPFGDLARRLGSWAFSALLIDIAEVAIVASPILAVLSLLVTSLSIPPSSRATLTASEGGLRIKRRWLSSWVSRRRLLSGLVVPGNGQASVELSLTLGGKLVAVVPREYDAQALLSMLGIDAARRRVSVRLGTLRRQLAFGCFTIPVTLLGLMALLSVLEVPMMIFGPTLGSSLALVMLVVLRSTRPIEVIVGTDGIVIRGAWRKRFIPYSTIALVELNASKHIDLKLKSGEELAIRSGDEPTRLALRERILDAMRAHGDGVAEGRADLEHLEPRGLPLSEWREALRRLAKQRGDYRGAGIPEDVLLSVVEDPDAAPGQRIGAAIALRTSGHEGAATRIRAAAEACASERVREALERAAEDELDEATLKRALKDAEVGRQA